MDENQLAQLYQQYLGRAPDPSGIATWSGQDPSTVIAGILGSQEYQSRSGGGEPTPIGVGGTIQPVEQNDSQGMSPEQILNKAYQDVFGRAPDPAAQGWLRDINAGLDLQGLKNILATTPEARNKALEGVSPIVGQNDPNNFVSNINQLYMSSLGRLPDKESLVNNLNLLNQNPDAFGWLSQSVTGSEEAQKYAAKTGIDQNAVYNQVTSDYGKWTPAASSPTPGGFGGFMMKYGPYLPFIAAAAASAPTLLAAEGATAGSGFVGIRPEFAAELGLSGGSGLGTAGASGNVLSGLYGLESGLGNLGYALPGDEIVTAEMAAQRAAALPELYPGGALPPEGYSTIYTPAGDVAYAPTADLEAYAKAAPSLLSTLGSALNTPLGRLGAMGGLGLLSGGGLGGKQQQPALPQMAGGGGTYAPRGQVDYTPILNLLAPRQISRNSLLG